VETFIDLFGKLFVTVRKSGSQFFIGKCMLDDEYYGAADQTPKEKCCIELLETFLWNGKDL